MTIFTLVVMLGITLISLMTTDTDTKPNNTQTIEVSE